MRPARNEVKHPTRDFMSVLLGSVAVKMHSVVRDGNTLRGVFKTLAPEVFQSTGNGNGSFQELVFAERMWELKRRKATGTLEAARLAALVFGALCNFNQTKQALQR